MPGLFLGDEDVVGVADAVVGSYQPARMRWSFLAAGPEPTGELGHVRLGSLIAGHSGAPPDGSKPCSPPTPR